MAAFEVIVNGEPAWQTANLDFGCIGLHLTWVRVENPHLGVVESTHMNRHVLNRGLKPADVAEDIMNSRINLNPGDEIVIRVIGTESSTERF